ncbi:AraC family transcriptional regulator [Bacillus inaquosorum]|uniref:AraC family transcriptional regulator n=1 Tax=Bacillus inaquosorum TaxID=483913 RepID=UPI00227FEB80|nr:helix-turn-helix domain-containing protein [Bacillus inaquosorum]MCY7750274.1 AraC family transcriptional regulator [Bacillus inaquosorum]
MELNHLVTGKIALNQYVHRLEQKDVSFYVHYWGAMTNHYNTLLHKHSFYEICYVVRGEGYYLEGDRTYPLREQTIFLSKLEHLHQIKSETGLFLFYVAFELSEDQSSAEWIKVMEEVKQSPFITMQLKDGEPPGLLWKTLMLQAAHPVDAFDKEILSHLSHALILSLIQTFLPSAHRPKQKQPIQPSSALLTEVKLHIKDNLSQSLKLTDVASHFHISGRHLSRLFAAELGVSYSEFVQNEKINKAAELLKSTNLSIKEVAEEIGFSVHYFTRVFSAKIGSSPGLFRSLYKDSKMTAFQINKSFQKIEQAKPHE